MIFFFFFFLGGGGDATLRDEGVVTPRQEAVAPRHEEGVTLRHAGVTPDKLGVIYTHECVTPRHYGECYMLTRGCDIQTSGRGSHPQMC